MMSPPTLAIISQEQEDAVRASLEGLRVHRTERAAGFCSAINAWTLGQAWFYMAGGHEDFVIVPIAGEPYTSRKGAFDAYIELSSSH